MSRILLALLLLFCTNAEAAVYTEATSSDVYNIPYFTRGAFSWDGRMNDGITSIDSILSILSDDLGSGALSEKVGIISDDMVDVRQSSDIISSDILGFSSAISTDSLSISGKYAFPTTAPTFAAPILSYDVATGAIIWHTGVGGTQGAATDLSNLGSVAINETLADVPMDSIDGNTLIVSTNSAYDTITKAMTAAAAGDTILVSEGTYTEAVTYTQDNLILKALGLAENTTITQVDAAFVVSFSTKSNCVLDGFTVSMTDCDTNDGDIVLSNNDSTTGEFNTIQNCVLTLASTKDTDSFRGVEVESNGNGSIRVKNNRIIMTTTNVAVGSLAGIVTGGGGYNVEVNGNYINLNQASTAAKSARGIVTTATEGNVIINNNIISIDSAGTTTGRSEGIYLPVGESFFVSNNQIKIRGSGTGIVRAIACDGAGMKYITGNTVYAANAERDADWFWSQTNTDYFLTGNIASGDCNATYNVGAATLEYSTGNIISGDMQFRGSQVTAVGDYVGRIPIVSSDGSKCYIALYHG